MPWPCLTSSFNSPTYFLPLAQVKVPWPFFWILLPFFLDLYGPGGVLLALAGGRARRALHGVDNTTHLYRAFARLPPTRALYALSHKTPRAPRACRLRELKRRWKSEESEALRRESSVMCPR